MPNQCRIVMDINITVPTATAIPMNTPATWNGANNVRHSAEIQPSARAAARNGITIRYKITQK